MLRSMTAYARAESQEDWGSIQWELRSVNNRYLDISTRLPDDLRVLEPAIRERLSKRLARGKVDCSLRTAVNPSDPKRLAVDHDLAGRIVAATKEIGGLLKHPAKVNPFDVLRWPGVVQATGPDPEKMREAALRLLDDAIDDLVATRAREGEKLGALIERRIGEIGEHVETVRGELPAVLEGYTERMRQRLTELDATLDEGRIEQELALISQKMDIAEELDRLEAHMSEVIRVLGTGQPVGRRLDFLMQELNREANTVGSKSAAASTTRASVDLKVLIEQMREQVQNLE